MYLMRFLPSNTPYSYTSRHIFQRQRTKDKDKYIYDYLVQKTITMKEDRWKVLPLSHTHKFDSHMIHAKSKVRGWPMALSKNVQSVYCVFYRSHFGLTEKNQRPQKSSGRDERGSTKNKVNAGWTLQTLYQR